MKSSKENGAPLAYVRYASGAPFQFRRAHRASGKSRVINQARIESRRSAPGQAALVHPPRAPVSPQDPSHSGRIRPRDTRKKLIDALEMLGTKRDKNPPKKHGNIPL